VKLNKGDRHATCACALTRRAEAGRGRERDVAGREHIFAVDDPLMVNVTVGCQWPLNRDSYQEPLNRDSYSEP
jgi:hypothetical protein